MIIHISPVAIYCDERVLLHVHSICEILHGLFPTIQVMLKELYARKISF
jgi:hypothetical protein